MDKYVQNRIVTSYHDVYIPIICYEKYFSILLLDQSNLYSKNYTSLRNLLYENSKVNVLSFKNWF